MKIELFSTLINLTDLIDAGGQITIGAMDRFPVSGQPFHIDKTSALSYVVRSGSSESI